MGEKVEARLYRPRNGAKSVVGELAGYEDGAVTLTTPKETVRLEKQDVAQVRMFITF